MGGVFSAYPEGVIGMATYKTSHTFAQVSLTPVHVQPDCQGARHE